MALVPEPGDTDPDPRQMLEIFITGTSAADTVVTFVSNDSNPSPDSLAPINVRIDGNVKQVDFQGIDAFGASCRSAEPLPIRY